MSMRGSKTMTALLLGAALAGLLAAPALAAGDGYVVTDRGLTDVTYSGALDPRTGLPAEQGGASGSYYPLRGEEYGYDRERDAYTSRVGGGSFLSSVPSGAVLSKDQTAKVSFTLPAGLTGTLYRDGNPVDGADLTDITEPGSYLLEARSASSSDSVTYPFTILSQRTNALAELTLPAGFAFEYVRLNGEELTPTNSNYLELLEDGDYELCWSCPEIGKSYTVSFTLDTTAPTLALPEVTDRQAHSAVTLEDLEEGAYILVESGGETSTITSASTVLRDPGEYVLTVYDRAGNSTRYDFVIHLYLNLSAAAAVGMMLAGLLALIGYSRYIRKHPRVG